MQDTITLELAPGREVTLRLTLAAMYRAERQDPRLALLSPAGWALVQDTVQGLLTVLWAAIEAPQRPATPEQLGELLPASRLEELAGELAVLWSKASPPPEDLADPPTGPEHASTGESSGPTPESTSGSGTPNSGSSPSPSSPPSAAGPSSNASSQTGAPAWSPRSSPTSTATPKSAGSPTSPRT